MTGARPARRPPLGGPTSVPLALPTTSARAAAVASPTRTRTSVSAPSTANSSRVPPFAVARSPAAVRPSTAPASAAASAAVRARAWAIAAPPNCATSRQIPPANTTSTASSGAAWPRSDIRTCTGTTPPPGNESVGGEVAYAASGGDLAHRHANHDAARRDHKDLVVQRHHEGGDHEPAPGSELDALHALDAPALPREVLQLGALAVAGVGDDEDRRVVTGDVAGNDLVARAQLHAPDPGGGP